MQDICFQILGAEDLPHVLTLQDRICSALTQAGTPRYIVPRTEAYFRAHVCAPHGMLGISCVGQHIGQAVLHAPDPFNPEELGVSCLPLWKAGERVCVVQGVLIDPDFRGQGLMKAILAEAELWCTKQGLRHLAARTEVSHATSRATFSTSGYTLIETVTDPRDGAHVCVFHKTLHKE